MLKLFLSFLGTFLWVFQYLKASCHLYNEIKTNSEIFQERKVGFYQTFYHKKFVVILNRGRGTDEKSFYEWKLDLANNFNGLYIQFGKVHFLQLTEFYGHQFFEYIFFFELFFVIDQFYGFDECGLPLINLIKKIETLPLCLTDICILFIESIVEGKRWTLLFFF